MLVFTGDINLTDWFFNVGFGIGTKISKGLNPFNYFERKKEDIWIANFEGVVSSLSENMGIYAKAFRVEPDTLRGLHHMDFYSLANNHAMEHGGDAFIESVKALESFGSRVFGLKKQKSVVFEYQGKTLSLTGVCMRIEARKEDPLYWHNPEYGEIKEELDLLPVDAFKVLFIHWGNEYINRPSVSQKKLAHWLIDLGFNLIIGMHPHVLQGFENYHGGRIYYSLGNCVFDMPSEQCKIGALVGLDFIKGQPVYTEKYLKLDDEGCPHVIDRSEIPQHWQFDYLNEKLIIDDNSEEYHQEIRKGYLVYRNANRKRLILSSVKHPLFFIDVLKDYLKRKI